MQHLQVKSEMCVHGSLKGEGKGIIFVAGRGDNQSLSPHRREVWREVCLWSIYLEIALVVDCKSQPEVRPESLRNCVANPVVERWLT